MRSPAWASNSATAPAPLAEVTLTEEFGPFERPHFCPARPAACVPCAEARRMRTWSLSLGAWF